MGKDLKIDTQARKEIRYDGEFGRLLLHYLAKRQDISRSYLAKMLDVSVPTISNWINSKQFPNRPALVVKIAEIFDLTEKERNELLIAADFGDHVSIFPSQRSDNDHIGITNAESSAFVKGDELQVTDSEEVLATGENGTENTPDQSDSKPISPKPLLDPPITSISEKTLAGKEDTKRELLSVDTNTEASAPAEGNEPTVTDSEEVLAAGENGTENTPDQPDSKPISPKPLLDPPITSISENTLARKEDTKSALLPVNTNTESSASVEDDEPAVPNGKETTTTGENVASGSPDQPGSEPASPKRPIYTTISFLPSQRALRVLFMAGVLVALGTGLIYNLPKAPALPVPVSVSRSPNPTITLFSTTPPTSTLFPIPKPNDPVAYNNRGLYYINQGEHELAVADFSEAIALDSGYALAYVNRADAYLHLNKEISATADYKQAVTELSRKLEYDHGYNVYGERGNAYRKWGEMLTNSSNASIRQEKFDFAIADYTKALELNSNDATMYYERGLAYWNRYRTDASGLELALKDFTKSIELDPQEQYYLARGGCYLSLRNDQHVSDFKPIYKLAIADYTKAIERNPDNATIYFERGELYAQLGDDEHPEYNNLAIADYTKALESAPNNIRIYDARGLMYFELGKGFSSPERKRTKKEGEFLDLAIADHSTLIELRGFDADYQNRADLYYAKGDYVKAVEDYSVAINRGKRFLSYEHRAKSYGRLGAFNLAIADYSTLIEMWPEYEYSLLDERASNYMALNDYDSAIADYTSIVEKFPSSMLYSYRAFAYVQKDAFDLAISDANKAIELSPNESVYYLDRAYIYFDQDKSDLAMVDYVKAYELDNSNAEVVNEICWYGILMARTIEVLDYCRRAVDLATEETRPVYRDSRGIAFGLTKYNIQGAIEDFNAYIANPYRNRLYKEKDNDLRKFWIAELQAGRNPFNEEALNKLRQSIQPRTFSQILREIQHSSLY